MKLKKRKISVLGYFLIFGATYLLIELFRNMVGYDLPFGIALVRSFISSYQTLFFAGIVMFFLSRMRK